MPVLRHRRPSTSRSSHEHKTESNKVAAPIERPPTLIDYFAGGEKARSWRIGTEHEKFVFTQDFHAPSYDERGGIRDLLDGLPQFGWKPVTGAAMSSLCRGRTAQPGLEPAGQLELSGAPLENCTRPATARPAAIWSR